MSPETEMSTIVKKINEHLPYDIRIFGSIISLCLSLSSLSMKTDVFVASFFPCCFCARCSDFFLFI